ncbi:hypothetical protein G7054_g5263 [Neopestalotiopsis clavispora]|nr:hypothetical protein G7054_g5263 [Neopestalotiopsis clavispora]
MSSINHYSIGWICAIDTEIIAAEMMFDELLGRPADIASNDVNSYSFGRISEHHIVVACLPHSQYGISNATAAVKDMLHSFPIKTVVMMGIAGGAPSIANGVDIRLGDVVYGFGKKHQDENDPFRIENTGHLNQPPLNKLYLSNVIYEEHQISCDACGDDPSTLVNRTARDPDDDDPIR